MDDTSDTAPALDGLRRQRAHRRGQITKTQKKIASLDGGHLDDVDVYTIDSLTDELSTSVSAHDTLQDQIEELLMDDPEASDLELAERDKRTELHSNLRRSLKVLKDINCGSTAMT